LEKQFDLLKHNVTVCPAGFNNKYLFIYRYLWVSYEIKRGKCSWIDHTVRKPSNSIELQDLGWNPQGIRRRGQPKMTSKRTTEQETRDAGKSWK
jgi:hypothetical protein